MNGLWFYVNDNEVEAALINIPMCMSFILSRISKKLEGVDTFEKKSASDI